MNGEEAKRGHLSAKPIAYLIDYIIGNVHSTIEIEGVNSGFRQGSNSSMFNYSASRYVSSSTGCFDHTFDVEMKIY